MYSAFNALGKLLGLGHVERAVRGIKVVDRHFEW